MLLLTPPCTYLARPLGFFFKAVAVEKTGLASLSTPAWQTYFSTSGKKRKSF